MMPVDLCERSFVPGTDDSRCSSEITASRKTGDGEDAGEREIGTNGATENEGRVLRGIRREGKDLATTRRDPDI
jgi:hypothetical protein